MDVIQSKNQLILTFIIHLCSHYMNYDINHHFLSEDLRGRGGGYQYVIHCTNLYLWIYHALFMLTFHQLRHQLRILI